MYTACAPRQCLWSHLGYLFGIFAVSCSFFFFFLWREHWYSIYAGKTSSCLSVWTLCNDVYMHVCVCVCVCEQRLKPLEGNVASDLVKFRELQKLVADYMEFNQTSLSKKLWVRGLPECARCADIVQVARRGYLLRGTWVSKSTISNILSRLSNLYKVYEVVVSMSNVSGGFLGHWQSLPSLARESKTYTRVVNTFGYLFVLSGHDWYCRNQLLPVNSASQFSNAWRASSTFCTRVSLFCTCQELYTSRFHLRTYGMK